MWLRNVVSEHQTMPFRLEWHRRDAGGRACVKPACLSTHLLQHLLTVDAAEPTLTLIQLCGQERIPQLTCIFEATLDIHLLGKV